MLAPRLICCVALTALTLSAGCQESTNAAAGPPPPPTVLFTTAVRRDVPLFVESVAALDGYVNADIRARVRGYLNTQDYKEGSFVKAGQRLFTIEPTEYETAVAAAHAEVARANATRQRNRTQLQRDQELFQHGAVSQQEIDNALAASADAEGQVEAAHAALEGAKLNLSYTQLRSPIEGVVGFAAVRVGNLVGQDGPTLLTTVSQIDPIRVTFPLSEADYVKHPERFKDLASRDLAWAKAQFAKLESGAPADHADPGIELVLSDGTLYPHRGIVITAGREIDPSTGTIQLQALVPNPDSFLRPGQYGRVRLQRESEGRDVIAVPDKALVSVQGSYSVGIVGDDNKVKLRRVEVGPSVNGLRLIGKGVSEGDKVVVEGVQKISDGALVRPKEAPQETASVQGSAPPAVAGN